MQNSEFLQPVIYYFYYCKYNYYKNIYSGFQKKRTKNFLILNHMFIYHAKLYQYKIYYIYSGSQKKRNSVVQVIANHLISHVFII